MKQLKFKFDLNSKVAIYVPSTKNVNEKIDNSIYEKRVLVELSKIFGGATKTPAVGGWLCNNVELVVEDVSIVYSFCTTEQLKTHFREVLQICQNLKKDLQQEAITLEVNGQIAFI